MRYTQQVQAFQEAPYLELRGLKGLDLKVDFALRDPQSWQLLENFDLFLNGSIRKVKPPIKYGVRIPAAGDIILNFIEYRQLDSSPVQLIGISTNGLLYDLTTGAILAGIGHPVASIPFLCVLSGTLIPYNFSFWQPGTAFALNDAVVKYGVDGNLYIFVVTIPGNSGANEPMWPTSGTVGDGGVTWTNIGLQEAGQFKTNYLIIIEPGRRPLKWDGVAVTQVGVALPGVPAEILATVNEVGPSISDSPHYTLVTGLQYAYTWFNPRTLAESSPSPLTGPHVTITEADAGYKQEEIKGSFFPAIIDPLATPTQLMEVQVGIPVDQLIPPYGSDFTHLRFYRSRDGGSQLFLLQTVYNDVNKPITDANGAVLPAQLPNAADSYRPLPITQQKENYVYFKDGYMGTKNFVPDPLFLIAGWHGVSVPAGVTIDVVPDAGQFLSKLDIQPSAFVYTGGVSVTGVAYEAAFFTVTQLASYTLQGYIDAEGMTSGGASWQIATPGFIPLLILTQPAGSKGTVSGTVVLNPGTYMVFFGVFGTCRPGSQIVGSNPIIQEGVGIVDNPGVAPLPDAALSVPAPGPISNGPPPVSAWGAVYQGSLYLLDYHNRIRLWFSGEYWEYFALDGFLQLDTEKDDQITSLEGGYDRLIVGKNASMHEIFGTDPTNFQRVPLDPEHGVVGRRLTKPVGSTLFAWINQGLATLGLGARPALGVPTEGHLLLGFTAESLIGEQIVPVTDLLAITPDLAMGCITIDNKQNIVLIAGNFTPLSPNGYNNAVLMGQLTAAPGFSVYSGLPREGITTVREVDLPGGGRAVLMAGGDGQMYQLFANVNPVQYTLLAQAVTQPLPLPGTVSAEIWPTKKVFNELVVEGRNLNHFVVSYSVDGGITWTADKVLRGRNKISLTGRQIICWFKNNTDFVCGIEDIISYLGIEYRIDGNEQTDELPIQDIIVVPPAGPPL